MTDGNRESFEAVPGEGIEQNDAHAPLDVEAALADATVVVPTDRERNYTVESLPDFVDREVATERGLNVARNRGIERADSRWIVLADDDITFPTRLVATLVDGMHDHHLVGLEDFWPMEWTIGRFMVFGRSLWETVGGFDESRPHGGDTDFAIRCEKAGATVLRLPRNVVPHHDAESAFSTGAHAEWLFYLFRRHPLTIGPKAVKLALSNLGLVSPERDRKEYPDGWRSQTYRPPGEEGSDA